MQLPPALLDPDLRKRDLHALRAWGRRLGSHARRALKFAEELRSLADGNARSEVHVRRFYSLDLPGHSFACEPHAWLRMTETQTTGGLAHFLRAGGTDRTLAFLRALSPELAWPADLTSLRIETEVPAGRGRIDLLITGTSRGRLWGAVIEAKLEHNLGGNPLSDYVACATARGLIRKDIEPSCAFVVVAPRNEAKTRSRLARNTRWCFRSWADVLRRFECELSPSQMDDDFRRFRRTLWERTT